MEINDKLKSKLKEGELAELTKPKPTAPKPEVKPQTEKPKTPMWQYGALVGVVLLLLVLMFVQGGGDTQPTTGAITHDIITSGNTSVTPQLLYHPDCHWCEKQLELFDRLGVRESFELINTQEQPELATEYQIHGTPAFRDPSTGEVMEGYMDEENLRLYLDMYGITITSEEQRIL